MVTTTTAGHEVTAPHDRPERCFACTSPDGAELRHAERAMDQAFQSVRIARWMLACFVAAR
jgi:hypothetical protein